MYNLVMQKPWFHQKKYGWGWGLPATWQGWVTFISYFVVVITAFFKFDMNSHSVSDTVRPYLITVFAATAGLILIAYLTSDKPKWRWGNDDKNKG